MCVEFWVLTISHLTQFSGRLAQILLRQIWLEFRIQLKTATSLRWVLGPDNNPSSRIYHAGSIRTGWSSKLLWRYTYSPPPRHMLAHDASFGVPRKLLEFLENWMTSCQLWDPFFNRCKIHLSKLDRAYTCLIDHAFMFDRSCIHACLLRHQQNT